MTAAQIAAAIALAEGALDTVLPLIGQPELVPIVTAAASLAEKVNAALAAKTEAAAIAAEVKTADVAADAAELAKFGK